jgi:hypothetical protein
MSAEDNRGTPIPDKCPVCGGKVSIVGVRGIAGTGANGDTASWIGILRELMHKNGGVYE